MQSIVLNMGVERVCSILQSTYIQLECHRVEYSEATPFEDLLVADGARVNGVLAAIEAERHAAAA